MATEQAASPASPASPAASDKPAEAAVTHSRFSIHSVSQLTVNAATVSVISVLLGLLRAGWLGGGLFKYQLFAFLATLSLIPYRIKLTSTYASPPAASKRKFVAFASWVAVIGGPVMYAFMVELTTGHRRPDSQWYDGVWRVYAILGLWIGASVANERIIKPTWTEYHKLIFGESQNSVASQSQRLASADRDTRLAAIKARVDILVRRRDRGQRRIEKLRNDRILAEQQDSTEQSKQELAEFNVQISEEQEEYDDIVDQLKLLQHEWTESLHIENYRKFYR